MKRMGQILVVLAMCAWGHPALAQSTGAVSGTVTASTGLALPGVTVTLRNAAGGPDRTIQTQTDGSYLFTNLAVTGTYEVQAELQGFATVVHSSVTMAEEPAAHGRLHALRRHRGSAGRHGPHRDTGTPAIDHPADGARCAGARAAARRPQFLALTSLTAGFTGNAIAPSPQGQIYWSNNIIVDGASHFSKWRGAARTFYSGYGLDSIREVQVLTSQFSAEFGEALATVTLAVTNSGTNTLRSSAFIFGQAGVLNDRPAFTPRRPPFSSERFGGTTGGPAHQGPDALLRQLRGQRRTRQQDRDVALENGAEAKNTQNEELFFLKVDHKVSRRDLVDRALQRSVVQLAR